MKNKISIIFLLSFFTIFSQNNNLTHTLSKSEKETLVNTTRSFTETAPPTGTVRNIAEWETMENVIIAYPSGFGIPYNLISEIAEETRITTIVSGLTEENFVRNLYSTNGVDLSQCDFVYQDPDSWWTRDYSPWYVSVDNSEVAIVNFPYNRPRPNDNDVPILLANELGIDLYGMDVIHTGGNIMCDGYGNAASTDLVWEENADKTHAEIDAKMQAYLGINNYHVTIDPIDEYIKHIDCWGKYLDVDKIMITQVPASDYRYNDYEFIANYFANLDCAWGYPYEVIRVQAATYNDFEINPYVNSLFLNNKIFVPQTGSDLDDDALVVYENAMPGYEIIGIYSNAWLNTDALHCRTHGIPDREMVFIEHYPLFGALTYENDITIEAAIYSYSGTSISTSGSVKLFYRQNNGAWQEEIMVNTSASNFSASFTSLSGTNQVDYYIYAEDGNGKTESLPRFGTVDPFHFSYTHGVAGLDDLQQNNKIKISPNPNNGIFTLQTVLNIDTIKVYDNNGKEVYVKKYFSDAEINVSNLNSGVYFLKLISNKNVYYQKFIIK